MSRRRRELALAAGSDQVAWHFGDEMSSEQNGVELNVKCGWRW